MNKEIKFLKKRYGYDNIYKFDKILNNIKIMNKADNTEIPKANVKSFINKVFDEFNYKFTMAINEFRDKIHMGRDLFGKALNNKTDFCITLDKAQSPDVILILNMPSYQSIKSIYLIVLTNLWQKYYCQNIEFYKQVKGNLEKMKLSDSVTYRGVVDYDIP